MSVELINIMRIVGMTDTQRVAKRASDKILQNLTADNLVLEASQLKGGVEYLDSISFGGKTFKRFYDHRLGRYFLVYKKDEKLLKLHENGFDEIKEFNIGDNKYLYLGLDGWGNIYNENLESVLPYESSNPRKFNVIDYKSISSNFDNENAKSGLIVTHRVKNGNQFDIVWDDDLKELFRSYHGFEDKIIGARYPQDFVYAKDILYFLCEGENSIKLVTEYEQILEVQKKIYPVLGGDPFKYDTASFEKIEDEIGFKFLITLKYSDGRIHGKITKKKYFIVVGKKAVEINEEKYLKHLEKADQFKRTLLSKIFD